MIWMFTDFGLHGPYLGQMQAVLHRGAPTTPCVNLFADAPAFNPRASAFLLHAYTRTMAPGDVCLAVVDPGVGDAGRRPVVLEADGCWYVGPDNGLFALVLRRAGRCRAWKITWRPEVLSASFHGRDLFAPVAARLAQGASVPGEEIEPDELERAWPDTLAEVIYVDHYGNLITAIPASQLATTAVLCLGGQRVQRAVTFSDVAPGEPLWYENSSGLIELAVNQGSAAVYFRASVGTSFSVEPALALK